MAATRDATPTQVRHRDHNVRASTSTVPISTARLLLASRYSHFARLSSRYSPAQTTTVMPIRR